MLFIIIYILQRGNITKDYRINVELVGYYNVSRHVASNLNIESDADEALLDSQDQYLHKPEKFKSFLSSILQMLKNDMILLVLLRKMCHDIWKISSNNLWRRYGIRLVQKNPHFYSAQANHTWGIIKSKATLVIRHRKVLSEVWKVIFTYTQWVYSTIDSILQFSLWSEFFMRNFSEEIWFPISFETQFSCLYCRYFWRKVMVMILDSFCDKLKVSILNYVFNITTSDTQLNRVLLSNISLGYTAI